MIQALEKNKGTNLNERLNSTLLASGTSGQERIYDRVAFALRYIGIARLPRADVQVASRECVHLAR